MEDHNGSIKVLGENESFYRVQFQFIPRVGEAIKLTSLHDEFTVPQKESLFEVKKVVHSMIDVKKGNFFSGSHSVTVYVSRISA